MKKLSDDTVPVTVKMPTALRDALDRATKQGGYANRSETARVFLEQALRAGAKS